MTTSIREPGVRPRATSERPDAAGAVATAAPAPRPGVVTSTPRPGALPPRPGAVPPPVRLHTAAAAHRTTEPGHRPALPALPAGRKPRPDPGPLRIAIGLTGLATASALMTAFLTPAIATTDATSATTGAGGTGVSATSDTPDAVRHITRIVQLAPGQTPPPNAVVQQAPAPTPQTVIVRSRQSGG